MKRVKLSIIIISYNTCDLTIECLYSLLKETKEKEIEIIVLDNYSSDGSAEAIEKKFPEVNLIKHKSNLGFAKGNNYCGNIAKGELLLLLNPDTVILDQAVDKLLKFSTEYPMAGIWGGKTLFFDKSLNPTSCWGKMTLWNLFCRVSGLAFLFSDSPFFNSEGYGGWNRDSIRYVDIVTGCFFLIKKSLWDEMDGFDETFFMYGEEADLCFRASALGYRPIVTDQAVIIHYGGASETNRSDKLIKLLKAKVQLIHNHWNPLVIKPGVFLLMMWPFSRFLFFSCSKSFKRQYENSFKVWAEVWNARKEWLRGYQ